MNGCLSFLSYLAMASLLGTGLGYCGEINVTGALVIAPCLVELGAAKQDIILPVASSAQLYSIGKRSTPITLTIGLRRCIPGKGSITDRQTLLSTSSRDSMVMSVLFSGVADADNPDLFALTGGKGVGLSIRDDKNRAVKPDISTVPVMLQNGNNILTWHIAIERTSAEFVPGPLQGLINFRVKYD